MEHGAVAIWYSPALLTADGVAELEEIAAKHLNDEVYLILAPYGSLDSTVGPHRLGRTHDAGLRGRARDRQIH